MSHPTAAAIESHALNRLDAQSRQELEEHLLVCAPCRALLSGEDHIVKPVRLGLTPDKTSESSDDLSHGLEILRYRTHLPLYSLEAAAGKFGEKQHVEPEGWVEVQPRRDILTADMFVTHIEGRSMQPKIPDGSLCAFKSNVSTPYTGKVLLLERYGEAGGNRYTISQYRSSKHTDRYKEGDPEWLHERFTLEPLNPEFPPWDVASDEKVSVIGEFAFLVQAGPSGKLSLAD